MSDLADLINDDEATNTNEITSFHLLQYQALRDETLLLTRERLTLQKISQLVPGLIIGWLASSPTFISTIPGTSKIILAIIPSIIVCFMWLRHHLNLRAMLSIGSYIQKIEKRFGDKKLPGWERDAVKMRLNGKSPFRSFQRLEFIYWSLNVLLTAIAMFVTLGLVQLTYDTSIYTMYAFDMQL